MSQSPSQFDVSSVNSVEQCDLDVTIPHRSFVFGQSQAKVSAGFTNVSSWKSQHSILYTAPCLSYGLSLSLSLVSSRRKVVIGY